MSGPISFGGREFLISESPFLPQTERKKHISFDRKGIFGADADIREQENYDIRYICWYNRCTILTECGYEILVTKLCNGGRKSYIWTNFIPNISAMNSKQFTFWLLNNEPPSAGQTLKLNNVKSLVSVFFPAFRESFNISSYHRTYKDINKCVRSQYWSTCCRCEIYLVVLVFNYNMAQVCLLTCWMPACNLQHMNTAEALHCETSESREKVSFFPLLLCPAWCTHCHAFITAAWASLCWFYYATHRARRKSFKEPSCFYSSAADNGGIL